MQSTCRAPKGDCAPSHVIDARATAVVEDGAAAQSIARNSPYYADLGALEYPAPSQ